MTELANREMPEHENSVVVAAPTQSSGWTREQIDLIKATVAKGTTDDEFSLFLYVCRRTGLDPLAKQIYAIKRWSAAERRETMAMQTGIDGFRLIASRTGLHAGTDDAVFDSEDDDHPGKASTTVYRFVQGQKVAFTASARWAEYVQTTKEGEANSFWRRMPFVMLAKVSESLALRKAFPADLSGIYSHEEMSQADSAPLIAVAKPAPRLREEPMLSDAREEEEPPLQEESPPPAPAAAGKSRTAAEKSAFVTQGHIGFIMQLAGECGVPEERLKAYLKDTYKIDSRKEIPLAAMPDLTAWLKKQKGTK